MSEFIKLRGCRLHNLKNVDVDIPVGKVTVVCGPSGCGKSTLILDTLHGECKRRYLETLSPFAAELLGGKRTIPMTSAEGLSASLAIGPTRGEAPAKATALSLAECDNSLRTLFATFARPACPICGKPMVSYSREDIIRSITGMELGTKLQFLARMDTAGHTLDKLSAVFLAQGFTRALADGVSYSLADLLPTEKCLKPREFFIVVDRIIVRENTRTRIAEAVDATLKLTHTNVMLDVSGERKSFSTIPCCPDGCSVQNTVSTPVAESTQVTESIGNLEPRSFSPYNRSCCCSKCDGTGFIEADTGSAVCPTCGGFRLKDVYLNASIDGISFRQILTSSFTELPQLLHKMFDGKIRENLKPTFNSLLDRVQAIDELGIGYLTVGRSGQTLSGGEMQRLKLASLSTGHLNGLLIALDEPASGLHSTDVDALWHVLEKVRKRGNTLILIEHNPAIISKADYIIEMGPGAGEKGGEILFQGKREDVFGNPASPTGKWLAELNAAGKARTGKTGKSSAGKRCADLHERHSERSEAKSRNLKDVLSVDNFALYDMNPVSAHFPIKKFSVITGQSGSGKSTLLFENIAKRASAEEFKGLGIDDLDLLTTGDFHGNRRSTVLSAINLAAGIRELFAKMPESKVRGYTSSKFSLNTPGGRCENCKGEGVIYDPSGYEETECPVCLGRRFRDEVLEIRFKSLSIADILDLEIAEAYPLFANMKPIADKLKPLLDTGLGYLKLGQTTAHLSGGERARLRLSIALARAKAPNTLFLFDEPARGLHKKDIELLLSLIRGLCEAGHTVIAIEHAQDFINAADYVVELNRN